MSFLIDLIGLLAEFPRNAAVGARTLGNMVSLSLTEGANNSFALIVTVLSTVEGMV